MIKKLIKLSLVFILTFFLGGVVISQTMTYTCTNDVQIYTVPDGVTLISIEAWGAEGGTGTYGGTTGYGGEGGYAYGELAVTPGQVLEIYVGGQGQETGTGGYNGGGDACDTYASSGGGASDVRTGAYTLDDRVIVAGGGGGASHGSYPQNGGAGGGLIGEDGIDYSSYYAGHGGTQTEGGAAGTGYSGTEAGGFGYGGGNGSFHNAGGGSGWYGGGSGAAHASAAGGSSYVDGVLNGTTTTGGRSGDGLITIVVLSHSITVQPTDQTDICVGDDAIFFVVAENIDTYQWTVSDDDGSSWTDLSDDGTYSGADTYSLTVTTDLSLADYQYSCTLTNAYTNTATDAATLTFETEVPTITCVGNQEVDADANHVYVVDGDEFDPTATDDNCEVESIINDFNDSETLDGAELPEGTTTITWTVTDTGGNEAECSFDVLVNVFVGIDELAEMGILVYPNPTTGIFTVKTIDNYEMTITDVSGKIIEEQIINNQVEINISKQASGIYFIQFKNNEMVKTMQIVKE